MIMLRTLLMCKPDVQDRKILGKIIKIIENIKDCRIVKLKTIKFTLEQLKIFYKNIANQKFFPEHCEYMLSGDCTVIVLEGLNIVTRIRKIVGATDPKKAKKNTIRAKYGQSISKNLIHSSDSLTSFFKEHSLIFE